MNFDESKCKKRGWLHKLALIAVSEEAVYERCERCGKKILTKLKNGNPDAVKYAKTHLREFLIPQHRLFNREHH